jgi:hypothetical protein
MQLSAKNDGNTFPSRRHCAAGVIVIVGFEIGVAAEGMSGESYSVWTLV